MSNQTKNLKNIYITGDVVRAKPDGSSDQRYNINWFYDLVNQQIEHATGIKPKTLLPTKDYKTCLEEWLKQFDLSYPSWHLQQNITQQDLIIGFELPPNSIAQFEKNKIPYINVAFWPIRYLDDIILSIQQNFYDYKDPNFILEKPITEETYYVHAALVKAQMRVNLTSPIIPNTALIIGQTAVDRSLISDGKVLNLKMFENRLKEIGSIHSEIFFKPHPYYRSEELINWLNSLEIKITDENVYKLLSYDNIECVYSISSSVLHEAKYFGKRIEFFGNSSLFKNFVPIHTNEFLSINFWAKLLSHSCFDLPEQQFTEIILPEKSNRLRKLCHNWWGYDIIDKG